LLKFKFYKDSILKYTFWQWLCRGTSKFSKSNLST